MPFYFGISPKAERQVVGLNQIPPYNKTMLDWQEYLSRDSQICGGELCAKGPGIPVTVILDSLGEGSSMEAILASYPALAPEHIRASLSYAAELAHEERLLPLRAS